MNVLLEKPWPSSPALVINAAQNPIEIGWWEGTGWRSFQTAEGEVLEQLFHLTQSVLNQSERQLEDAQLFIYNTGPGSLLGLRLAAMAIATWRTLPQLKKIPLLRFSGLQLTAFSLAQIQDQPHCSLLSDFRRGSYNLIEIENGTTGSLATIASNELDNIKKPLFFQPGVRSLQPVPESAIIIESQLKNIPQLLTKNPQRRLLQSVDHPIIYTPEEATFVRWSAQRHR